MKLRDKKTGEVRTVASLEIKDGGIRLGFQGSCLYLVYKSFAKLCADWEDVKEPLIKDEETRKAVRAWAKINGDDCYYVISSYQLNDGSGYAIEFANDPFDGLKGHYTIRELCGDD